MPYPAQVDYNSLIETAHQMIEDDGLETLSLSKLAAAFDVKAPSLYKHVKNKAVLLREVNLLTQRRLVEYVLGAAQKSGDDPRARILALMNAYREFAHQNPHTYPLAYHFTDAETQPDPDALLQLALPVQNEMAAIVGEPDSLAALRGAWALVHGFVMLELGGQFQRGGDLPATFEKALQAYLDGWATSR